MTYRGGDAEVLQLVLQETDVVFLTLLIQLAKGIVEWYIIVFTGNLLSLHPYKSKTADEYDDDSFHGLFYYYLVRLLFYGDAFEEIESMQYGFK